MPRVIFTDKLIRSGGGHNLEYCLRLVEAFGARGYEPVFLVNREFKGKRPPNLKPVIAFDFNRVVLGQEARAKKKAARDQAKRLSKRRMRERFYFSWLGIGHLALNEMRRGRLVKATDRNMMLAAFLVGSAAFGVRFLGLIAWILTWPVRVLARLARKVIGRFGRSRVAHGLRARWDLLRARLGVKEPLRILRAVLQSQDKSEQALVASIGKALSALQPTAEDIVFCTTTVSSDLNVYLKVLERFPKTRRAHWNFIFREPIFFNQGPSYVVDQVQRGLRTKLIAFETMKDVRTGWWVDTEELAEQYTHLGVFDFGALPIPMPAILSTFASDPTPAEGPLNIGYLGDARPEKGYGDLSGAMRDLAAVHRHHLHQLYKLADLDEGEARTLAQPDRPSNSARGAMMKRRIAHRYALERALLRTSGINPLKDAPRFTMLAQSNFNVPEGVPLTQAERYRLMAQDDIGVQIILTPPSSEEYVQNVRRSDLFMLNYRHPAYHAGSSGVFAEAAMAGRPALVSDDTWGGRRLRTAPEFIAHLKQLAEEREIVDLEITQPKHPSYGVAWRILPKAVTHLVTVCDFAEREVTDQLAWVAEFQTASGAEIRRRRLLCSRQGVAAAIVEAPEGAVLVRFRIERLNPLLQVDAWSIRTVGVDMREFDRPLAAVGMVVSDSEEIAPALADIGRHYAHYRATAASFSKAWGAENDARLLADKVIAHVRGEPIQEAVEPQEPPVLNSAA